MENRELLNYIPSGTELPDFFKQTAPINILDNPQISLGEHLGKVRDMVTFHSKNKQINYAKLTLGTRKKFAGGDLVQEVERVFLADYHVDSELVKTLEKLGCIENHKFYPERLLNKAVRFTVKEIENVSEDARYKTMVTDIEPIDSLSEDIDFKYVKVFDVDRVDYVPTFVDAKPQSDRKQIIGNSPVSKIELPEEEDDNFLDFD